MYVTCKVQSQESHERPAEYETYTALAHYAILIIIIKGKGKKVNISLLQAMEAHSVARG
jgi:hypothetical protein